MRTITLVALTLLLFAAPAWSASSTPDFSARVKVSISATDDISDRVNSYIKRELRALGDVTLVDEGPDYALSVVAMTVATESGDARGVAFSVVALRAFYNRTIVEAAKPDKKGWVNAQTRYLYNPPIQELQTGALDDLRSICSDIVAWFDTHEISPDRELWQSLQDAHKEH